MTEEGDGSARSSSHSSPSLPFAHLSFFKSTRIVLKIKRAKLENSNELYVPPRQNEKKMMRRRSINKRSAISADWLVPACAPQLLALSRTIDYLDRKGLSVILFCTLDLALDCCIGCVEMERLNFFDDVEKMWRRI